jgi:hypothetical protein
MSLIERLDKYANYLIIASNEPIRVENVKAGKDGIMEFKGHVTRFSELFYPDSPEVRVEGYEIKKS